MRAWRSRMIGLGPPFVGRAQVRSARASKASVYAFRCPAGAWHSVSCVSKLYAMWHLTLLAYDLGPATQVSLSCQQLTHVSRARQSQPIATPQVRLLTEGELAARRTIIARLRMETPDASPNPSPSASAGAGPDGPLPSPGTVAKAGKPQPNPSPAAASPVAGPGLQSDVLATAASNGGPGAAAGVRLVEGAAVKAEGVGCGGAQECGVAAQGVGGGADRGPGDSSSSDEDTDDEAFAARHHPEEFAEYQRNRAVVGEHLPGFQS